MISMKLFLIVFLFLFVIYPVNAEVIVSETQICDVGEFSQIFPFLEVCKTVKGEEHSPPSPSGGGSSVGSTGFEDEQKETIIQTITEFEQPKLSLLSTIHYAILGEFMENRELPIDWTNDDLYDLTVTGIIIEENPLLITFANPPFIVSLDEQIIRYNVQIPNKLCENNLQIDCVKPIFYEIPITISGLVNGESLTATETLKIDLTPPEFNIPFMPIIIIGGIIGVVLIIASHKHNKNKNSEAKRPIGQNKQGNAKKALDKKRHEKGEKTGSAKASIDRYKNKK